jgi:hypothetical protein
VYRTINVMSVGHVGQDGHGVEVSQSLAR